MTVDCARDPVAGATINLIGSLNMFEAAIAEGLPGLAYVSHRRRLRPGRRADTRSRPPTTARSSSRSRAAPAPTSPTAGSRASASAPTSSTVPASSSGIAAGPSIALRAAFEGRPATIRFSGRVGFVHVEEVAGAFVAAADAPSDGAEACTLAGETADMDAFLAALRAEVPDADIAVEGPPLRIPPEIGAAPRPALLADVPQIGLADGIARTLAHYRNEVTRMDVTLERRDPPLLHRRRPDRAR